MSKIFKKACVTGGAGFIGSHLVNALLKRKISVNVLDNLSIGKKENISPHARLIKGDILDPIAVDEALEGCDIVFHLAARVAIRSSFDFAVEDTKTNIVGTTNVMQRAAGSDSIDCVINTSSMAVYADADSPSPVNEHHTLGPISPYGISKLAAEQLTQLICSAADIDCISLRLFNTFGTGQKFSPYVGVVTIFANKIKNGEIPAIFGDGEQCRDFVHVDDVVSAFMNAMDNSTTARGEIFNIGSGTATTVNSVLEIVKKSMKSSIKADYLPTAEGELRYSIADIGKAVQMLGFQPKRTLQSSVDDVLSEIFDM